MQTEANPAAGTATAAQKSPHSVPPLRGWSFPVSRSRPVHLQCKGHHPRCQHVGNVASDVITPIKEIDDPDERARRYEAATAELADERLRAQALSEVIGELLGPMHIFLEIVPAAPER